MIRNFLILCLFSMISSGAFAEQKKWLQIELGIIGAASYEVLVRADEQMNKNIYEGMILKIDSPGGTLGATRKMVKLILNAKYPILSYVGPAGAHAASAASFIALAAHRASMAPGTSIGAAHPVEASGKDIESKGDLRKKIQNDTAALMRSIAQKRSRNEKVMVSFVIDSVSLTAEEALEKGVIDSVDKSPVDLLSRYLGKSTETSGGDLTAKQTDIVVFEKLFKEKVLEFLSDPNIFYLLFMAGIIGLGFELTHPGVLVPGVLGGISLILALISSQALPVNVGALALIVVAMLLMVAEAFVPSFGILGIGGVVGFILGSVFLVDDAEGLGLSVSLWTIIPSALFLISFVFFVVYVLLKVRREKKMTGVSSMIGRSAEVVGDFTGDRGRVYIDGEYWNAKKVNSSAQFEQGQEVYIKKVDGLLLHVESHFRGDKL